MTARTFRRHPAAPASGVPVAPRSLARTRPPCSCFAAKRRSGDTTSGSSRRSRMRRAEEEVPRLALDREVDAEGRDEIPRVGTRGDHERRCTEASCRGLQQPRPDRRRDRLRPWRCARPPGDPSRRSRPAARPCTRPPGSTSLRRSAPGIETLHERSSLCRRDDARGNTREVLDANVRLADARALPSVWATKK